MKKVTLCLLAVASFAFNFTFSQTPLSNHEYGSVIEDYLKDQASDYNFEDRDIEDIVVTNSYQSESTQIQHVYINQAYNGVRIFNAISSVAVKNDAVFYYANRFLNKIEEKVVSTAPTVQPIAALQTVANHLNVPSISGIDELERGTHTVTFSGGNLSEEQINVELVLFPKDEQLRPAWDFIIYALDHKHWWSVRVDALNNQILEIKDLILTCKFESPEEHAKHASSSVNNGLTQSFNLLAADGSSYNVFPLPVESPSHGSRQLVSEPGSSLASPFGWHDNDGNPGPEFSTTNGNNVWAKEDLEGSNSRLGYAPQATSGLTFDFPLDFNLSPLDYQDAAITNLFYTSNMMHDIWYHHGFDEAAGNFQTTNYTGTGLGNDFVFADAQDGSGFNNANFGTPPDGFNPRMQMFLWSPPGIAPTDRVEILNGSLAGIYNGRGAVFGQPLSAIPVSGNLVLAVDNTPDVNDACEFLTNSLDINGKIAVIRRGTCEFGVKVLTAENAGAIGVIMVNNEPGPPINMGPGVFGDSVTIPSIMVSQDDGEAIITALNNGQTISANLLGPDLTDFIDGDFDNGIIAHEYAHGISNRLTGGPAAAFCLQNNEQMGEGWSDWIALMVTMSPSDVAEAGRGIGTFAISQPTTGGGIRPARYSTDFGVNDFTFNASNSLAQPHGIGFVWATVLWDLTWAYIDKYGFDPDLYNGTGGNNKVMQLVIDGLKLQPCSPGFIDGRDALLAADLATTGGEDQCLIWEVFAARGLGVNAVQGDSNNRLDQIEDFTMPPSSDPSLANCTSLSLNEVGLNAGIKIFPNPTSGNLTLSTAQSLGDVTITITDLNGRVVYNYSTVLHDRLSIGTNSLQSGVYILTINGNTQTYKRKFIKN